MVKECIRAVQGITNQSRRAESPQTPHVGSCGARPAPGTPSFSHKQLRTVGSDHSPTARAAHHAAERLLVLFGGPTLFAPAWRMAAHPVRALKLSPRYFSDEPADDSRLLHGPCTRNRKIIVPTDSVLSSASQAPVQPRRLHRVAERNRVAVCSLTPTRSLFGRAVAARITRAGAAIRLRQRKD